MHPAIAAGRVALITGAASRIGRAAPQRLHQGHVQGDGLRLKVGDVAPRHKGPILSSEHVQIGRQAALVA